MFYLLAVLLGSDVVDWLQRNVEGFTDRREARKYAENLLKGGYIRHTVRKVTFSEQCYYVFGEICAGESMKVTYFCFLYAFMQRCQTHGPWAVSGWNLPHLAQIRKRKLLIKSRFLFVCAAVLLGYCL